MSYTPRIYSLIQGELCKQIAFTFSVLRNHSRPGAANLAPGDRFRFSVDVTNNSDLTLTLHSGTIAPGLAAEFRQESFAETLAPREKKRLVVVEGEIVRLARGVNLFDQIGKVSVSIKADLSDVRFRESERPLVYSRGGDAPSVALEPAARADGRVNAPQAPATQRPDCRRTRPRALPLSSVLS
ncbi:MAG: hypothetical protein GY716_11085 [bacterium]|nr:hypothetical protein [bacterium]